MNVSNNIKKLKGSNNIRYIFPRAYIIFNYQMEKEPLKKNLLNECYTKFR